MPNSNNALYKQVLGNTNSNNALYKQVLGNTNSNNALYKQVLGNTNYFISAPALHTVKYIVLVMYSYKLKIFFLN